MMKKILLFAFLTVSSCLLAQPITTSTPAAMKKAAEEAEQGGNPYAALEFYDKVYDETKEKEILVKIANLNYELRDYAQAERNFQKLLSRDRANNYIELRFWYAMTLKANEKCGDAIDQFNQYIADGADEKLKARAKIEIEGCRIAKNMKQPENLLVKNAGKTINSPQSESSPSFANGELYFTSLQAKKVITLDGKEGDWFPKVFTSSANNGQFSAPVAMGTQINREGWAHGNVYVSQDGKTMFFTRVEMEANTVTLSKIFYAKKTSEGWGAANEVVGVNGDYIAKHPCEGELFGEKVLFFVANMPGGKGGDDIYYAPRKSEGVYGLPVNLGEVINTAGDEISPFYLDGKLYYSSNGRPTIGGLDVFMSEWNGSVWSAPKAMDRGINSSVDDFFYSTTADGFTGYLVSNRPGPNNLKSKTCCDDIYIWEIERIKVNLAVNTFRFKTGKEKENPSLEGCTVQVFDLTDRDPKKVDERTNATTNNFDFTLQPDRSYRVIAFRNEYRADTLQFNTVGVKKTTTIEKKITLRRERKKEEPKEDFVVVKRNEPIRLNQIYYDFDDDKILPDAEKDLQFLVDLMSKYPDMKIELSSHTDAQGKDDYNEKLSQRRAESARRWMIGRGINGDRIVPKGYGESQILNGCTNGVKCSDEQHRFNRRTEFKIIAGPTEITIEEKIKKEEPTPQPKPQQSGNKPKNSGGKQSLPPQWLLDIFDENIAPQKNRLANLLRETISVSTDTQPPHNSFSRPEDEMIKISTQEIYIDTPPAEHVSPSATPIQPHSEDDDIPVFHDNEKMTTQPDENEEVTQNIVFDPAGISMKFDREVFHFGTVKEGKNPSGKITLTNDGSTPLEIETISTCYCLSVQESTDFIRPGQSATFQIVFDSHDQVGNVSKDIDIIFKNTDKEGYPVIKRIKVRGKVVK